MRVCTRGDRGRVKAIRARNKARRGETASCWREKPEWPLSGVKAWVSRGTSVDLGVSHEKAIRLLVGNGYLGASAVFQSGYT